MAAAGFGVLLVACVVMSVRDLSSVRSELVEARALLQSAIDNPATLRTAEGRTATRGQIDAAIASAAAARQKAMASKPLSITQFVPVVRGQRAGMLVLIDDVESATVTARDLLVKVDSVAARAQMRDGQVPLDAVAELSVDARSAAGNLRALVRTPGGLWGPVGDARRRFDDAVRTGANRLADGADALDAVRGFVAADGTRRHLIALQNNAEMRNQGAVLSYATVRFDDGRFNLERQGSIADLPLTQPAPTPVPEGTAQVFGFIQPTQTWQSVNATADFALSGRAMADMYRQSTGETVEGVIGIDVPALAALLRVTGPVAVAGIAQPVSAENVAPLLLNDLYQGLGLASSQTERREKLSDVMRAVIDRLKAGSFDAVALGRELGDVAAGGHFRLWSGREQEESVFERTGLGGGPAVENADRTIHVAVENRNATKVDYFVKPTVRQDVDLQEDGTAVVRTTVVVPNGAPAGQPPSYQFGPDQFMKEPGEYGAWVLLWGPAGSEQGASTPESGLLLTHRTAEIAPGASQEMIFETTIPDAVRDGELMLRLVPQPRLEPVPLQVNLNAPGWDVNSPASWSGPWDRVITLRWDVSR